jgi:chromate transport protein ChrA
MKPKYFFYLVWYSIKSLVMDLLEIFSALKRPKTWSFILYATLFLMIYYRKLTWTNFIVIILLIFIIYTFRQNKEPFFLERIKEKAFLENDKEKIKDYYNKYCRGCFFQNKHPLKLDEFKAEELRRINERKYREQGKVDD